MYLSIDFGTRIIGLAVGKIIPKGFGVIENDNRAIEKIALICQKNDIEIVIVGMPIRSAGEEGTIASKIREFSQQLADKSDLPIYFEPEQFTSAEAERQIRESGEKAEKKKIDELSAILILEQFIQRSINEENLTPHILPSKK